MEPVDDTERLRALGDAVLLAIGRNLLIYQRIEGCLKRIRLITMPVTSASDMTAEDVSRRLDTQKKAALRQSLGQTAQSLTQRAIEADTRRTDQSSLASVQASGAMIATLRMEIPFSEDEETALDRIIRARNRLAHNFLSDHAMTTIPECEATLQTLDSDHDEALALLHALRTQVELAEANRKHFMAFVASGEFDRLMERAWLCQSPLVNGYECIATGCIRPDGWWVHDTIEQRLRQASPEQFARLKDIYGHRTLRATLEASGLFEFREEPTRHGHRLLARMRPLDADQGAEPPER